MAQSLSPDMHPTTFSYHRPEGVTTGKKSLTLAKSDIARINVQLIHRDGGETNLHSHTGADEIWFVLSGRVRWYGSGDKVIAEQGKNEGILIPRGVPYWFESASDEPLEIVRFGATDMRMKDERVNYEPVRERQDGAQLGGRAPTEAERKAHPGS